MSEDLNEWLQRLFAEPEPEPEPVEAPPAAPCLPNPGEPIQIGNHEPRTIDEALLELSRTLPGSSW